MPDADGTSAIEWLKVAVTGAPDRIRDRVSVLDELVQHGGTMAIATILSGGLNYAFQVYVGRALGPTQYGVFGALTAMFYLVNVFGRGVRFSAARFTAELRDDPGDLAAFHRGLLLRTFAFSLGLFALLAATSPLLADFLDVSSPWPVVVVAAAVPFSLTFPANLGLFQGRERFVRFGSYKAMQAGVKFLLAVLLLTFGFGLFGAFGAIVAASVLVLGASTGQAAFDLRKAGVGDGFDYGRAYRYALPAVLAGFCLTVPASVDVVLAKAFFTSTQAGLYTAVSVLGKILIFLPVGISMALFPKVSDAGHSERAVSLFDRAMLYTAVVAGAGAAVYWLVPEFVLGIVYTSEFAAAGTLLAWYGLAIFAFALAVVVLNYQLARDNMRYVYLFALCSVGEIALMWLFHESLVWYAWILLAVNAVLVVGGTWEVKR